MRNRLVALLMSIVGLGLGSAHDSSAAQAGQAPTIRLRVLSDSPDEQVTFKGAYLFQGDRLRTVERSTPFEVTGTGPLALGIFERVSGAARLRVERFERRDNAGMATGARVIVGQNVMRSESFARGY
jgi:hypothetical protein